MTRQFPVYLNLEGRRCAVVGGGRIATGRVRALLSHGAKVRLVTPEVSEALEKMVAESQIEFRQRPYEAADVEDCVLVIAATDRREVNAAVARDARARGAWCNVVDRPGDGDVTIPARVNRGRLQLALTTGGASPAVAAAIRGRLEALFGPEWEVLLDMLAERRDDLVAAHPDPQGRAEAVRALLDGDILARLADGDRTAAEARLDTLVDGGR